MDSETCFDPVLDAELADMIQFYFDQLEHLIELQKGGIIKSLAVAIDEMTKNLFLSKEQRVLNIHDHTITKTQIKKKGKLTTVYQTTCGDMRPRCTTYEALINKLYEYYFGQLYSTKYSFEKMFDRALEDYILLYDPKATTIRRYKAQYRAFITPDIATKDIRTFTTHDLNIYFMQYVKENHPTRKKFYKLKNVFNLVFNYATDKEINILDSNPMPESNKRFAKHFAPDGKRPEQKAFSLEEVEAIREECWRRINTCAYRNYIFSFAILLSTYTGLRQGEIPALRWEDIDSQRIHIHSQQILDYVGNMKVYKLENATKNEKGVSKGGRYFPLTDDIRLILSTLKDRQEQLGIKSEWVFCHENGEWITTRGYYDALRRLCKGGPGKEQNGLGLDLCNNHALRISFNSYVLLDQLHLEAPDRAKLVGHFLRTVHTCYPFLFSAPAFALV